MQHYVLQERGTVTEPPPRITFSSNVTQWEIYDAYQDDFAKQASVSVLNCFIFNLNQCFVIRSMHCENALLKRIYDHFDHRDTSVFTLWYNIRVFLFRFQSCKAMHCVHSAIFPLSSSSIIAVYL